MNSSEGTSTHEKDADGSNAGRGVEITAGTVTSSASAMVAKGHVME